jgi:alkyl sulfatase BDS1-like metallo-beta-lactamase superfamily hydrolase
MGGPKKVLAIANKAAKAGDYRWASTLLGHLTRADPTNKPAKEALAQAYEQLAYQAEAAPWRDFYLTGAKELREGILRPPPGGASTIGELVPIPLVLDALATRLVPERALGTPFTIGLDIKDTGERYLITVANGVLLHETGVADKTDATIHVTRTGFLGLMAGRTKAPELLGSGALTVEGDIAAIQRFTGLFEQPKPTFPLVTPLETK